MEEIFSANYLLLSYKAYFYAVVVLQKIKGSGVVFSGMVIDLFLSQKNKKNG